MIEYSSSLLGNLGKVSMCKRVLKSQTSSSGEIPFYKISTFGSKADAFIDRELFEQYKKKYSYPKIGDILISASGTIGKTVIYQGEEAFFQDSNIVWIDNDESLVLNDYLYYFYQLKPWNQTSGSTIQRLYNDNLRNIKISYPVNKEYQKKIISVPKKIDEIISNNNSIICTLEEMAQKIYEYWFLQYNFPYNNAPYKSSGNKMINSDLLNIDVPSDWKICSLNDICQFKNGINYDKDEVGNKTYKIVNVRNITSSSFILNDNDFDNISLNKNYADKYLLNQSDILIARSGTPGAVRIVIDKCEDLIFSGFIITCTPKNPIYKFFLAYYIKQFEGTGATKTGGSILQNVSQDTLKSLQVCLPPEDVVEKFNNIIVPILNNIQVKIKENNNLESLKNFILPMLMNGQIKIED